MRKLVTVRKIDSVYKHPNADVLDIVQIDGWQCVSRIGTFKPNDLCVYVEIDSFVPVDREPFKFLEGSKIVYKGKEGARIKTIKLRKEISQGLALPLSDFSKEEKQFLFNNQKAGNDEENEEIDFASFLGISKWEPALPSENGFSRGRTIGNFPSFVPKTDEERIQNYWKQFGNRGESFLIEYENPETKEKIIVERPYKFIRDTEYEVSIKLDGTSMTVYLNEGKFGVCSRNLEIEEDEKSVYWQVVRREKIEEKLREFDRLTVGCCPEINVALQGELIGKGIQGNNEKLDGNEFYVFNVYDIESKEYLNAYERRSFIEDLNNELDFDVECDTIKNIPLVEYRHFDFENIQDALKYADGPSLNPNSKREGVVFKCIERASKSFKIISNEYLLAHGDR